MGYQPRVLVADDAPTVTLLVERALEAAGYHVTTVSDGAAACEAGLTGEFDLALLDHLMPNMLGAEVLQHWSDAEVGFRTIILSGMDHDELVIELLEMGAVDFIRKPFNITELVVRVRRHLPAAHVGK